MQLDERRREGGGIVHGKGWDSEDDIITIYYLEREERSTGMVKIDKR